MVVASLPQTAASGSLDTISIRETPAIVQTHSLSEITSSVADKQISTSPVTSHQAPESAAAERAEQRAEVAETAARFAAIAAAGARQDAITLASIREAPLSLSTDKDGHEFRAGEIVIVGGAADIRAIIGMGLNIVDREPLPGLGASLLRVSIPLSLDREAFEAKMATGFPKASVDSNNIYRLSASTSGPMPGQTPETPLPHARTHHRGGLVGMIDTPVDARAGGISASLVEARAFAASPAPALSHGTAVAYLAAQGGARLLSASVFSRDPSGHDAASLDSLARALDWLVGRGAVVINMSLEGPPNRALADLVRRAQARGCVIVAAAGNGGPAAPPAYPAAYPSVVAVTAVDARGGIYTYANRGSYIMFAARGVAVKVPQADNTWSSLSGTSYAAPVVSALIGERLTRQDSHAAAQVIAALQQEAKAVGTPHSRDTTYGFGLLAL